MQLWGSKETEAVKWMRYFDEFIDDRIRGVILSLSKVEVPRTRQPAGKDTEEQRAGLSYRTTGRLGGWVRLTKVSEAQN